MCATPCPVPTSHTGVAGTCYAHTTDSRRHSMGLGPTYSMFLYQVYRTLATPTYAIRLTHACCTHQMMTTPPPHVADVEEAERRFHVPAMPSELLGASDDIAGTWKCFSASSTLAKILYVISPRCATNPINQEAQGVPFLAKVHTAQPPPCDKPPHERTWCHGVVWNR